MSTKQLLSALLFLGMLAVGQAASDPAAQGAAGSARVTAMTQPALSPDGAQIAFAAGGAIWTVPNAGGVARLLIADSATASRPLYSPDGRWLAFDSTRTGGGDIYLLDLSTSQLRRLSWDSGMDALDSWSPDSQWIYFTSSSHNVGGMNDIYRVRATGGTPMILTSERYESEYDAAAAPDGSVTFIAGGEMALSQWWRNGEAHIDQTAIWSVDPASMLYQKLVEGGAKQIWPMWTPSGGELFFMSDRGGAENIWIKAGAAAPRPVTSFTSGRVLWPSIGSKGQAIVFERDFGIWRLDLKSRRAAPVPIRLEGAPVTPSLQHLTLTTADSMAVSPDGKKVAYTAHGEIFAVGTESGGEAIRLTHTGRLQFGLEWSPDSQKLVYLSDCDGHDHLYQYDFLAGKQEALTSGAADESHPVFSPDGRWLAFQRGMTEWLAMDMTQPTRPTHQLAQGHFGRPPLDGGGGGLAWSPDSQYVAYLSTADGMFENPYVVSAAGGESQAVSFLADTNGGSLSWSPDSKYLLFQTGQRTEPTRIARVDLQPHAPIFREDRFHDLFEPQPTGGRAGRGGRAAAAAPPPPATRIVYAGIDQRTSLLPMTNARGPRLSPDGKWLAYVGGAGGRGGNIYLYS
ncbi:MAG: peptidase S41, partial [Terriglobales bacterium]